MNKLKSLFRKVFGIKRYRYYLVVVAEKYNNTELPDTYVSGYIFRTEEEAHEYAAWMLNNTVMYESAVVDRWDSDTFHLCTSLVYPADKDGTVQVTFVPPVNRF